MSSQPDTREFVWREAQAVLLDQLRRNDPAHALRRATRSLALAAGRDVLLSGGPRPDDAEAVCWPGRPTASLAVLQARGWAKPLDCTGERVGTVWFATGPAGEDRAALLDLLAPLLESTAELLALWLESRGERPPASLSLVQMAMREAGTYVWEWDLRTDVLGDIDEGALMLGYDRDALGHTQAEWDRIIHPDDAAGAEADYQAHARGETPLYQTRYRARAADGSWRWVEERGRVVERDADLNPVRMLGTQTDATLQHALEEAHHDRAVAQAANAAKTQFLSRVSHELRTPLHAVLSFARLMATDPDQPLPAAQQRRLTHVQQAGEHLQALIDDLLDLSLVEAGRLHLQPEAVALADLLAEVQALIQPQADAAGIVLDVPPVPPGATVRADARRLRQVLLNLVSNAIKYNRPHGRVQLTAQAGAAGWTLAVADTGGGIAPAQLSALFQPFNRLGREHGSVDGVGLGLALSQMLVQAMGGEIRVDSVLAGPDGQGGGTTFRVTLAAG